MHQHKHQQQPLRKTWSSCNVVLGTCMLMCRCDYFYIPRMGCADAATDQCRALVQQAPTCNCATACRSESCRCLIRNSPLRFLITRFRTRVPAAAVWVLVCSTHGHCQMLLHPAGVTPAHPTAGQPLVRFEPATGNLPQLVLQWFVHIVRIAPQGSLQQKLEQLAATEDCLVGLKGGVLHLHSAFQQP